jgi:uncharacterized cupin superfamily protein
MTAQPTQESAVALRHHAAGAVQMPAPQPKPTSRTGQHEATLSLWESGARTSAGVWECEPGEFTAVREDFAEVCHILAGRATVTGEDGTSAELAPGSFLILPRGWRGTWVVHETIRKTYVMIEQ